MAGLGRGPVVAERLKHLSLLEVKAEHVHGNFELVVVDRADLVCVGELEGHLGLLLLLVKQLRLRMHSGHCNCCGV